MGLKSGEYVGKYKRKHPDPSINPLVLAYLLNAALSITTVVPLGSSGSRIFSSQVLNTLALHPPWKVNGAMNL